MLILVRAIDHMICDVLEKADHYYNFKNAIHERKIYAIKWLYCHEIEHSEDDVLYLNSYIFLYYLLTVQLFDNLLERGNFTSL